MVVNNKFDKLSTIMVSRYREMMDSLNLEVSFALFSYLILTNTPEYKPLIFTAHITFEYIVGVALPLTSWGGHAPLYERSKLGYSREWSLIPNCALLIPENTKVM